MLVVIRGAGDLASGIALRLFRSGFQVAMTETEQPTTIRRTVAFSSAVTCGEAVVEDVAGRRAESVSDVKTLLESGVIPVLIDPDGLCIPQLKPDALVDAILAKRNLGTRITDAPVVVGVGPGFTAGVDCHAVVETMRGTLPGPDALSGLRAAEYRNPRADRRLCGRTGPPRPCRRHLSSIAGDWRAGPYG